MSDLTLSSLLALAPPAGADPNSQKASAFTQFGMIAVMMVIFWVLLIRPQQKKAKEQAAMLKTLKRGDKVTTSSGIVGVVAHVDEATVTVRSGDTKLEVTKSSVTEITERGAA
jgi:preprotein translocase subunit YajC